MADNVLRAIISVTAPGAERAFKKITDESEITRKSLVKLGGQTNSLANSIETLRAKAEARKSFLLTETDVGRIGRYNREIKVLEAEIVRIQSIGAAGTAGIAGGLTKGLSGLRTLAYILPGLGIAGIFNLAFDGLQKLISGLAGAGPPINAFKEAIGGAGKEVAEAHANVSILREQISLAKDGFINKDQVVKEYNDTIGKTTGLVKNIGEAETALNRNAEAYIQFTLLKAAANLAFARAGEEAFNIQQAILNATRGNTSADDRIAAGVAGATAQQAARLAGKSGKEQAEAYNDAFNEALGQGKAGKAVAFKKQFEDIGKSLLDQAAALGKKFGFNFFENTKPDKPIKAKDLVDIPSIAQLFQDFVLPDGALDAFQKSFRDAMLGSLRPLSLDEEITKDINDSLQKAANKIKPLVVPINLDLKKFNEDREDARRLTAELGAELAQILEQGFENVAFSIGDALGKAVSGQTGALEGILGTIGDLLQQVGRALIQFAITKKIVDKILSAAGPLIPAAAILAAGILAVAAGAFLKGIKGRASGGLVTAGTPYVVGERGPELFVPDTGGRIVPNRGSGGWSGNMGMGGQQRVVFEIAGTTLQGVLALSAQQMRRLV